MVERFFKVLQALFPAAYTRMLEVQELQAAQAAQKRVLEASLRRVRLIHPDDQGLYPLLLINSNVIDPNRGLVIDGQSGLVYLDDRVYSDEVRRRALTAMSHMPARAAQEIVQTEMEALAEPWPSRIPLSDLTRAPSIHNLVIGAQRDGTVISASLAEMMHTLVIGASGWGKSVWLQALIWQLAKAPEAVQIVAIDLSGSAFNVLHNWDKLRYPVVRDSVEIAVAVLAEGIKELERRKGLYNQYPLVESLPQYNEVASERLEPWLYIIDEGTALLAHEGIADPLRTLVQGARQYGMYFVMSGQTAKHNVIETPTRDQCSTRLCFHTTRSSSQVVLESGAASSLRDRGRMYAQLPGRQLLELQGPWVDRRQLLSAVSGSNGGGPQLPSPEPLTPNGRRRSRITDEQRERISELLEAGQTDTYIAREVFKYGTMFYIDKVRTIRAEAGLD